MIKDQLRGSWFGLGRFQEVGAAETSIVTAPETNPMLTSIAPAYQAAED